MGAIIKIGLVGFFCAFIQTASAQYFSKRYQLTASGYISSIQVVDDTIYTMCGVVDTAPPHHDIGDFVRFDKMGNLISQNFFRIPGKTAIGVNKNNLIKTRDGGFAYGGWASGQSQSDNSVFIAKYDHYGNLEWYKDLPDTNYLNYYSLAFVQDSFSNYYFTGFVTEKFSSQTDVYLTKADSLGNLIYMKTYVDPQFTYKQALGIGLNSKGHIILSGSAANIDFNNYSTQEVYLTTYEIDTGGNILKYKRQANYKGPVGGSLQILPDNSILTGMNFTCSQNVHGWTAQGAIILLDSNYNIVWQIDTGFCSQNTALFAIAPTQDSNFIAVGYSQDLSDSLHNHVDGWIMKFSPSGTVIWSKLYRGFTNNSSAGDFNLLYTLNFLSDGSIITGAQATDNGNSTIPQQGWLLHLDTAGCLPDSNSCGIVNSILGIPTAAAAIRIYPNPSSATITVECILSEPEVSHLTIYDQLGQSIYERDIEMQEKGIEINVRQWPAAFYTYRLTSASSYSVGGSFVVSH